MKNKHKILGLLVAVGLFATYFVLDNQTREVNLQANFPSYESIESLEKKADLIIVGKALDKMEIAETTYEDEDEKEYFTKRSIKVAKVLVNNTEETVEKNDEIIVREPTAVIEDSVVGKLEINLEGYKKMKSNKKYVLFLKKGLEDRWVQLGIVQGKYPVDISDKDEIDEEFHHVPEHYWDVHKKVIKKYKE